jgi:hypothetical protein
MELQNIRDPLLDDIETNIEIDISADQNNFYIEKFDKRFEDCMDSKRLNDLVELGNRFKMIQKILADAEYLKITASKVLLESQQNLKSDFEKFKNGDVFDRIKLMNKIIETPKVIELSKTNIATTTEFFKYVAEHQGLKQLFNELLFDPKP